MKQTIIKVTENNDLVKYLTKNSYSKNKIKTYIKLGFIYINDKQIKKLPQKVLVNDIITIKKEPIILFGPSILINKYPTTVGGRTSGKVNNTSRSPFTNLLVFKTICAIKTPIKNTIIVLMKLILIEFIKGKKSNILW